MGVRADSNDDGLGDREWRAYLPNLQAIIHFMPEGTHLHLSHERRVDVRSLDHVRCEPMHLRQNCAWLVVDGGVQGHEGEAPVVRVVVFEDDGKHVGEDGLEGFIQCWIVVRQRESKGLNR